MSTQSKPTIVAVLMMLLTIISPSLMAQNKQANSTAGPEAAGPIAEGKILWEYNTHG